MLHLDAGGLLNDYMADLCRMGAMGEPGRLARDLHEACLEVQERSWAAIKPGVLAKDLQAAGERAVKETPFAQHGNFIAHGIGMISHEAPVVNGSSSRSLEAGMVLSIETAFHHPEVGHVKIEDAVAVTEKGCEGLGDLGREFQVV